MNNFDWDKGFTIDFDFVTGMSKSAETTKRYLSQMKDMYHDQDAVKKILSSDDPVIYEFYELGCPERAGDLAFGTSIVYPGTIGNEYYMTKGHFHTIIDTCEVYFTLNGEGMMIMEDPEGDTIERPLRKGETLYVPRRYAHRSVNIGDTPLVMYYVYQANAGHDYGTIETKGYHKMLVSENGKPAVVDNPKWN